jgi:hypothetical protein
MQRAPPVSPDNQTGDHGLAAGPPGPPVPFRALLAFDSARAAVLAAAWDLSHAAAAPASATTAATMAAISSAVRFTPTTLPSLVQ